MATDVGRKKAVSTAEYESRVQDQLTAAEKRIRTLDLAAALLTFAAATLAYAVGMALLDHWLALPAAVRQAGLAVYLVAAAAYLTAFVGLPLSRRINPYFAARRLERTSPDAKNSVVNWLDLREANLPPAIRGALGRRAAQTLDAADPEKAVSGRRAYTAGAAAAVCAVACLITLFTLGFGPFFGLLGRAFSPFEPAGVNAPATRTRIRVVKPVDGNAVVPDDRAVDIFVRVDGRVPDPKADDALKLLFRYDPSAPYQQRLLEPDDGGRWGVSLPPIDVKEGFWYKVAGGDAETPEYRVRLTPRVLDFKAVYHFRPYTARADETRTDRKIEALRGTQVDVTVHTNRDVKDGRLQFETANGVTISPGELLPGDPQAFTAHLTLDESSPYRICFTSIEGEAFVEPQAFPLIAVPDKPPVVALTKPVESKDKPGWIAPMQADGVLELEGSAVDDVGVAEMWLNLRVDNGPALPNQEYRSRKELQLPHGGNPTTVEYKDFVDLEKLKNPADPLFTVQPGMVLEYWLTAEDACDYPDPKKPNVGESKHYRVLIAEPLRIPQVQKQAQDKAEADKKDHDAKQDQQLQDEDKKRQQENEQKQKPQNDGSSKDGKGDPSNSGDKGKDGKGDPSNSGDKGGEPKNDGNAQPKPSDQPKPGDHGSEGDKKPDDAGQPNPKSGDKGNNPNPNPDKKDGENKDKELQKAADDVRKGEEGAGKPDPKHDPSGAKEGGQDQKQPQPADGKDGGKEGTKDAAQPKDGPQDQPKNPQDAGAAKQDGPPDTKQPHPGDAKPGGDAKASPDAKPGEAKDGKTEAPPQPGASKTGGKPEDAKQAGDEKPQPAPGDKTGNGERKEGNPSSALAGAQPAEAKDKTAPEDKAAAKGAGPETPDKNAEKSVGKGDGAQSPMNDKPASAKPGADQPEKGAAEKKSDGSEGQPPKGEPKAGSDDEFFKKLKDDLKSSDPEKRQLAEDFIRRYLTHDQPPEVEDRAKKTLQDAGLDPDDDKKLTVNKPEEPPPAPDAPPQGPKAAPADAKPDGDKDAQPMVKDNPPNTPDNDGKKGESKGDGQPKNNDPMNQKPPPPAIAKGVPGNGVPHHDDGSPPNEPPPPLTTPEKPVAQPPSLLQLRNFYQSVPKDVLKDVIADPGKLKTLQAADPEDTETLPGSRHDGSLTNKAGKVSNPNTGPTDDPNTGGRPQPPPGYRDPYKEFTKLLSPGGDK